MIRRIRSHLHMPDTRKGMLIWTGFFTFWSAFWFTVYVTSGNGWWVLHAILAPINAALFVWWWRFQPRLFNHDKLPIVASVDPGIRYDMIEMMAKIDNGTATDAEVDQVAGWIYSKTRYPSVSRTDLYKDFIHLRDERRDRAT